MQEYYKKHPELSEDTKFILWVHKPILDIIKEQEKKIKEKHKKPEIKRESWQKRIEIASDEYRKVTENNEIVVLEGIPLDKVTEEARKAYLIQEESRLETMIDREGFGYGADLDAQCKKVEEMNKFVERLPKRLGQFSIDKYSNNKRYRKKLNKKLGYDKTKLYYKRSNNE